jgi:ParB-like chromosome segregation protein Spo0J
VADLAIVYRPLGELIPYARNARTHSDEQVAQIAASIREFGWTNPILLDGQSGIVAGHGRVLAARKLGIDPVPCIELAGLSEAQRRAYIIADNKLALNAGWDEALLRVELADLRGMAVDLSLIGFGDAELSALVGDGNFAPGNEADQGTLDKRTKAKCPNCGHEFDP